MIQDSVYSRKKFVDHVIVESKIENCRSIHCLELLKAFPEQRLSVLSSCDDFFFIKGNCTVVVFRAKL